MATVTPYEGAQLSDPDVRALHGVLAAALAADRPEDPVPSVEDVGRRRGFGCLGTGRARRAGGDQPAGRADEQRDENEER